jgi:hypothetical protein
LLFFFYSFFQSNNLISIGYKDCLPDAVSEIRKIFFSSSSSLIY